MVNEQSCQKRVDNQRYELYQRRTCFHADKVVPVRPADKAACNLVAGHLF